MPRRTATSGKGGRPALLFAFFALTTILPLSPLILRLSRQSQQQRPEASSLHSASDPRSLTNGTLAKVGSAADDNRRTIHGARREEREQRREEKRKQQHLREGMTSERVKRRDGGDGGEPAVQGGDVEKAKEAEDSAPTFSASAPSLAAAETAAGKGKLQLRPTAGTSHKPRLRDGAAVGTSGQQRYQRKEESLGGEDREVAREGGEKGGLEEERCVPVSECELCPPPAEGGGTALPTGCAATNRRRRFECRSTATEGDDAVGRRYRRYLPCDRTDDDENYLVIRMQFICLVIGVLAMYVVRREKNLHGTSFDKRILAARNKISRGGGDGAATGTSGGGVTTKKKKGGTTLSDYAYHSVAGAIIDEEEDDGEDVEEEEEEASPAADRTPPPLASGTVDDPGDGAEVDGCWRTPMTTKSGVPTNLVRMASV